MRRMPIKYRADYRDNDSTCEEGFETFIDSKDRLHLQRFVEIEVERAHSKDTFITFTMKDVVLDRSSGQYLDERVQSWAIFAIWAFFHPESKERKSVVSRGCIIPTREQAEKIHALADENIIGEYAVNVANQLYLSLIVGNEISGFSKYLPRVKEWYDRMQEAYKKD
jgi:hypothetical protein